MRFLLLALLLSGCASAESVERAAGDAATDDGIEVFVDEPFDSEAVVPPVRVDFGPTVIATPPPPPISGGTLIIARDGHTAVAADPDRDMVWIVDLDTRAIRSVVLEAGDEPGRLVEDEKGHVFVALRRSGAVAKIDLATAKLLGRNKICAAPRGLAFDAEKVLRVACAGGELLRVYEDGGQVTMSLAPDLRDVVLAADGSLYVTRFRTADIIKIGPGDATSTVHVPAVEGTTAGVAWRTLASPDGGITVLHQRASGFLRVRQGGYGASLCNGPVTAAVSHLGGALGDIAGTPLPSTVLAVDVALAKDGRSAAVVAPGGTHTKTSAQILRVDLGGPAVDCSSITRGRIVGEPTAVAFTPSGRLVVQSRQPAALVVDGEMIALPGVDRNDTGHMIFHGGSGFGIACASCHVEGNEDGVTWTLSDGTRVDKRRTQSIADHVLGRAPFHWDGSLPTFTALVDEVFVHRMLGPKLEPSQLAALARYVDAIPRVPSTMPSEVAAVDRGRTIFEKDFRCSGCHSGATFTDGALHDVGTGGNFKTPSLLSVSLRPPFLHDGCAPTLEARFDRCGGGDAHGKTSSLSEPQRYDLIRYLQSL